MADRLHYRESLNRNARDAHCVYYYEHLSKNEREGVPLGSDMPTEDNLFVTESMVVGSVTDAPSDGLTYGRKNAAWVDVGSIMSTGLEKSGSSWRLIGETPTLINGYTHLSGLQVDRLQFATNSGAILIGSDAGLGITGVATNVIFIGKDSGKVNSQGQRNIGLGDYALSLTTLGDDNLGIGFNSLYNNVAANKNVAVGNYSLETLYTAGAHGNTALGYNAARYISGVSNTVIGSDSAIYYDIGAGNVNLTSLNFSVFIGAGAKSGVTTPYNVIAIGYNVESGDDNTATIGNASVTDLYVNQDGDGNVRLGGIIFSSTGSVTSITEYGAVDNDKLVTKGYVDNLAVDGTVTSVSSETTNQLTVENPTTAPALTIVTGAIIDGGTALATSDTIYDFVLGYVFDPAYAELFVVGLSGVSLIASNWTYVTGLTLKREENVTTTSGSVTAIDAGIYKIDISASFKFSATVGGDQALSESKVAIFLNGTAEQSHLEFMINTSTDLVQSGSISGFLSLITDSVVSIKVISSVAGTFTMAYGNFSIHKIA